LDARQLEQNMDRLPEKIRAALGPAWIQPGASLLRNGPLLRLLSAQFSSLAVVYGLALAGVLLVEQRTQSSAQTGLAVLSAILPAFLGSLVSGAVVDRWGRVRVLLVSHLGRALAALAFWLGARHLPLEGALVVVYSVNAITALFSQFAMTAELALLPDLAGRKQLIAANTLYQFSLLLAEGVGIILLPILVIKLGGVPAVGLLGVPLCLLALLLVATLPRSLDAAGTEAGGWSGWSALGADLQSGWRTIARDRLLRLVVLQATFAAALLLVLVSLGPGMAARHLGLAVEDSTLLALPGGLGFALGAFFVNRWQARASRQAWISAGLVLVAVSIALLALSLSSAGWSRMFIFQIMVMGVGLALSLIIIPARAVLEEHPPAEMRGRVIAAQLALGNLVALVPLVLGGALADRLGFQPVMAFLSLLALVAGVTGLRGWRG
jgi:DHA3 family macrolide efflux protein-like MFS transporter